MARNEDVVKNFETESGLKQYDYDALANKPFGDNEDGTVTEIPGKYVPGSTFELSGNTLTITAPDGKKNIITLPNDTYTLSSEGNKVILTDSNGYKQEITVISLPETTADDAGKVLRVSEKGEWETGDVPQAVTVDTAVTETGVNPVTSAALYTFVNTQIDNQISSALAEAY